MGGAAEDLVDLEDSVDLAVASPVVQVDLVDVVVAVVEEDLAWTTGEVDVVAVEDVVALAMVTSLRGFMRLCPGWMWKALQERPGLTNLVKVSKAEEEQMRRNFGSKGGCENTAVLHSSLLQVSNFCMNV